MEENFYRKFFDVLAPAQAWSPSLHSGGEKNVRDSNPLISIFLILNHETFFPRLWKEEKKSDFAAF